MGGRCTAQSRRRAVTARGCGVSAVGGLPLHPRGPRSRACRPEPLRQREKGCVVGTGCEQGRAPMRVFTQAPAQVVCKQTLRMPKCAGASRPKLMPAQPRTHGSPAVSRAARSTSNSTTSLEPSRSTGPGTYSVICGWMCGGVAVQDTQSAEARQPCLGWWAAASQPGSCRHAVRQANPAQACRRLPLHVDPFPAWRPIPRKPNTPGAPGAASTSRG